MIREIDINFTTIIDLLSKILEDKKICLKAKNVDLQHLNNKYILIASIIKEITVENYIGIYYNSNDKIYKKKLKQLYIILRDIKYKYNKAKKIIEQQINKDKNIYSIVEISNILFASNIEYNYAEITHEALRNSNYEIKDLIWISKFINNIKESNIINSYLKYKKINNSDKLKNIKDNISYDEIKRVQYKLDCLLNNKYALAPPIYINDFTDYFITSNFPLDISEEQLLKYISDIQIDNKQVVKLKWYNYFNRKKLIEVKNYNKKILSEHESMKKIIFEQYKENIASLKMYVKSFEFLKSIVKDSYFDRIYNYLYDENEMFIYLNTLSNNLSLFKERIVITNEIKALSDKEIELLDFCYDKYDTISKYKEKLYSLPTIIIEDYLKEHRYEYNKSDIRRENLDELIVKLNKDIDILKLFFYDNFNILSNLIIVNDIKEIENIKSNEFYILNKFECDDCIHYIDESFEGRVENCEVEVHDYYIIKFIKETITNLGYKIVENYRINQVNLELAVVNPKQCSKIVYVFIDCFQINSYYTIRKLSYIKEKNIPIIYCWSDDFLINKNIELLKLKMSLKTLLSE